MVSSRLFLPWIFLGLLPLQASEKVDFARDVRPILSSKCFFCHGPDETERKADLRLDTKEGALSEHGGIIPIVPGDTEASEAWLRIVSDDPDEIMPPPKVKKEMTSEEKDTIRRWIEQGADWSGHWAFEAPTQTAPPTEHLESRYVNKVTNEIDAFILSRLQDYGHSPSPEADRRTLIRRLSFDLTGLPPSPKEVANFVEDPSPLAYESLVDRLLQSKRFGERMALMWLDAARYGDTSVMHADGPRDMWPWRDWVIEAYNSNQPYDQFSIEQIAGDLIPDATLNQKVASGFNRNHPSSDEGGAIAEELRVSYVVDRVKTTANVWLGLSMECAQCHDHKYDPISQKEYFQFYAYFNNTTDPGMQTRRGNQAPFIEVVSRIEEGRLLEIDDLLSETEAAANTKRSEAFKGFVEWNPSQENNGQPIEDGKKRLENLRHYFPLDEPGGTLLCDVRSRKDAVSEKPLKTVDGKFGKAVVFDGNTSFRAPGFTELDNRSKFSFAAWIKIDSPISGAIFSKMNEKNQFRGFDFWLEGGKVGAHLINTWPGNAVKVATEEPIETGKWQHVALTYNGGGKSESIKVFVNGELRTHTQLNGKSQLKATMKTPLPFVIGGRSSSSRFKGQMDEVRVYNRVLTPEEIKWTMEDTIGNALATDPAKQSGEQKQILRESYLSQTADDFRVARAKTQTAALERIDITTGKVTTMIMADNPADKMRPTYLLERGAYDAPVKDEVIPVGTPAFLPPLPEDAPPNRLALANWLFTDEHPLTARVAVNQIWQLFFGTGIVATTADFGNQGEFPSHPELLDWLAVDFRENGWDTKRLVKQILMSQTYRQASWIRPGDLDNDPDNRYLARAPRFRIQAEMIRDNALALSGLLVDDIGGPGVKPYQPPGLWAEVGLSGKPIFVQDKGDKLYRRSLYTYWKRSAPHPAMLIFDAPNRETCVMKRPNTNTPLQALAAMNDVQMIEAARHLAERILREGGDTDETRSKFAFELATAREPTTGEVEAILELLKESRDRYGASPDQANGLLKAGESPRNESIDVTEHASWTLVANLILNLDEVLTRN